MTCDLMALVASECRVWSLQGLQQDSLLQMWGQVPVVLARVLASWPRPVIGRPLSEDMPPLDQVLSAPRGARDLWSMCLNAALAGIIAHRDSTAWMDFPLLPSLVLPSPARGGSSRTGRSTKETRRRSQDLLNGHCLDPSPRGLLLALPRTSLKHPWSLSLTLTNAPRPGFTPLIAEVALRRACTALTADPPVSPTPAVIAELRLLHPGPTAVHRDVIEKLRPVSAGAVPDVDSDLVCRALATSASTWGAGPRGLRHSHLQDALSYSSGDQTLRLLSEVILLMMKGEIPEDVRPWVCGASLMGFRKPIGSFRPVAVSETLHRL